MALAWSVACGPGGPAGDPDGGSHGDARAPMDAQGLLDAADDDARVEHEAGVADAATWLEAGPLDAGAPHDAEAPLDAEAPRDADAPDAPSMVDTGVDAGVACTQDAECDDGDECTADACSLALGVCVHGPIDRDGDGASPIACGGADCDDERSDIPSSGETCDGADEDCDGVVDEEPATAVSCRGGRVCIAGACQCSGSERVCADHCVDVLADRAHCGECDRECSGDATCAAGECACAGGLEHCDGLGCVDLLRDRASCGACGRACGAAEVCAAGACEACGAPGELCCDGGVCDPRAACTTAGVCACASGAAECGAACVDLSADDAHCGACDAACGSARACLGGSCERAVITTGAIEGVALDASGNVYLTGRTTTATDFGGESAVGGFVVSYTSDGSLRWARSLPSFVGIDVAVTPDGQVTVCGELWAAADLGGGALAYAGQADVAVLALTSAGGHVWSRAWGGVGGDQPRGIVSDDVGNLYVTGRSTDAVDLGAGLHAHAGFDDAWVQALGADGSVRWTRHLGTAAWEGGTDVATDRSGNVYVTGWRDTGSYVASWTGSGVLRWQFARASNIPLAIVVDDGADVYVAGRYSGPSTSVGGPVLPSVTSGRRAYLASYTSAGAHRWSRAIGSIVPSESDTDYGLELGPESSLLVVGGYTGTSDFGGGPLPAATGQDAFVARFDRAAGAHLGSARAHTSERDDVGLDVAPVGGFSVVVGREGTFGVRGFVRYLLIP